MYSKYYDKNFDVAMSSYSQGGKEMVIISHDALQDIIHNQIPSENKVMYDFQNITVNPNIPVFLCTICDKNGRRVQEIGEATPRSLTTNIGKSYPSLLASQRAFDRAAIRFLNFEGKIYSNMEIDEGDFIEEVKSDIVDIPEENPVMSEVPETSATGIKVKEEVAEEQPAAYTAAPIKATTEEKAEKKSDPVADDDAYGKVVVNMGKYKNKGKTVAEICAEDRNWLKYIASMTATKSDVKEQVDAAVKYLEQHPEE